MAMTNRILYIEPFYGGSHQQLVDLLQRELGGVVMSLPATKWHWRMRVSALHFALNIPHDHSYKTLFASSVLNLCELVSLRPDLASLHKVLYFHENQLVYPVRKQQDRDFQYGYNQILSCLVADLILFNSHFNMDSFLNNLDSFLKQMPDHRPKNLSRLIRPKCQVVYYPLELFHDPHLQQQIELKTQENDQKEKKGEEMKRELEEKGQKEEEKQETEDVTNSLKDNAASTAVSVVSVKSTCSLETPSPAVAADQSRLSVHTPLHIVWPHRWEHDKGPEELCGVLQKLLALGAEFCVSILGSHTNDIPASFQKLFLELGPRLIHHGTTSRDQYWQLLQHADVVVSTAKHEFFGVAMLEATHSGCYPLCPNRLVYPEIYPRECLYNTDHQLVKRLQAFSRRPSSARRQRQSLEINIAQYSWTNLKPSFIKALHKC